MNFYGISKGVITVHHWWKINITLTNGKEINGFILASDNDHYKMPKIDIEYVVAIYERQTTACPPEIYHIACNQVAYYRSKYLSIEYSLRGI